MMKKIECDYKLLNFKYGYLIEQMDNGLFQLKYQVWDDGKSWNWNFPPGWAGIDNDSSVHIYQYIEDAKRDGNAFLIQKAAHQVISIGKTYAVWFWNENESLVAKQPINNLKIYSSDYQELWSISEFFGSDEMCSGLHKADESKIYFYTFSGIGVTLEVKDGNINCVEKKLVK